MALANRVVESFQLWDDLASVLDDDLVSQRLPTPSNTIWDQFWCVVGARESYARAIAAGSWQGFSCSLTTADRGQISPVSGALSRSREDAEAVLADGDKDLVLDLLLHEVQHQGQVIRYMYGLEIGFPDSWKLRWKLD